MTAVLDASALLALLKDESGADIVAAIPQPVIASVNLTEVVIHFARHALNPTMRGEYSKLRMSRSSLNPLPSRSKLACS